MITETSKEMTDTQTVVSHYAGPGEGEPAWTYDETSGAWSRYIAGFGGLLATEEQGKEAVLQLQDLDGDIIGTAILSEAASKPLTTERSTTFGVPVSEKPVDKYNWLGASGLSASLPSGAVVQDGRTYVPQLGASLQTEAATAPAIDDVVAAPVVITMAPPTDCKYEEGILPTETAETPAGEVPEPYDPNDPEFLDHKNHVHFKVGATITSLSDGIATVSLRLTASTPGVPYYKVQYLGLRIKKMRDGTIEEIYPPDEIEGKKGASALSVGDVNV